MFAQDIYARVNTILASAPYHYTRAIDPFNPDQQPGTAADGSFYVGMELVENLGLLGWQQGERHEVTISLIRSMKQEPHRAYERLLTDITSLQASLAREEATQDYLFEDEGFTSEIIDPDDEDAFVRAELSGIVNFERAL